MTLNSPSMLWTFSSTRPPKRYLTRSQKRENNRSRSTPASDPPTSEAVVNTVSHTLCQELTTSLIAWVYHTGSLPWLLAGPSFHYSLWPVPVGWDDHLRHISDILCRLGNAGLTVKVKKCQFAMSRCAYLGHIVGNGEVRTEEAKVIAPKTKKQVRAFLGLTGYYRRFIPNYADTALPLTDLTRKDAPNKLVWTPHCQESFTILTSPLLLSYVARVNSFCRQMHPIEVLAPF